MVNCPRCNKTKNKYEFIDKELKSSPTEFIKIVCSVCGYEGVHSYSLYKIRTEARNI